MHRWRGGALAAVVMPQLCVRGSVCDFVQQRITQQPNLESIVARRHVFLQVRYFTRGGGVWWSAVKACGGYDLNDEALGMMIYLLAVAALESSVCVECRSHCNSTILNLSCCT